jgi:hypothetical protein
MMRASVIRPVRVATVTVATHHHDHHQRAGENQNDEEQVPHSCLRSLGGRVANLTAV